MRLSLVVLASVLVAGCGSAPPLYLSEPATPETVVDGVAGEWPSALRPVPGEAGLSLGLRRDGDALVVAVIAGDERQARRIALGGLRVWIDPAGGTDRALGIRYPAPTDPDLRSIVRSDLRPGGGSAGLDPVRLRRQFEAGLDEVEVTRGVLTQRARPDGTFGGLTAASTWGTRGLIVEMRIPLAAAPGLLKTSAGEAVGLGVDLLDVAGSLRQPLTRRPDPAMGASGDRPMPPRGGPALAPAAVELATVTRWLRVE